MKNWKRLEIGSKQTSYTNKYTLFNKNSIKDDLPLKLPDLKIAKNEIERKKAIKFLGVMLDENVKWQEHIRTVENKISGCFTVQSIY